MAAIERLRRLLPAAWFGLLACIAFVATPAAFAVLPQAADAGRVNGRIFMLEAWTSVALALLLWLLERGRARRAAAVGRGSVLSTEMVLLLAALLATVLGYFVVQQLLPLARAGQGSFSFGQLHAASVAFFGVKLLLVAALAWRGSAGA